MIHTPLTLTKEAGAGHGDYQLHNNQYQVNILGGKYRIDNFIIILSALKMRTIDTTNPGYCPWKNYYVPGQVLYSDYVN